MKGDFTRMTFDPAHDFTAVLRQQGRVQLDSDWSEDAAIEEHLRHLACIRKLEASHAGVDAAPGSRAEMVIEVLGGDREQDGVTLIAIAAPAPGDIQGTAPATYYALQDDRVMRTRHFSDAGAALEAAGLRDFELSTDEDGATTIRFGDGRRGNPPPSGVIVSASYRYGSGAEGNVAAGGLTAAANPRAAEGGVDHSGRSAIVAPIACSLLAASVAALAATTWIRARAERDRRKDDLGIALLDALAVAGDVLSAYQERVANEGYLGTAGRRRSVCHRLGS